MFTFFLLLIEETECLLPNILILLSSENKFELLILLFAISLEMEKRFLELLIFSEVFLSPYLDITYL